MEAAVLVSGLPAAGKSTLSNRLGRDLGFVVICRDRLVVGSGLRDVQSFLPPERSVMVPAATDRLVDFMTDAVLNAGHGVIIDNNFNWPEQRTHVRRLLNRRRCPRVEVCLWGDPGVLKARFAARADPPMDEYLSDVFDVAVARPREPVLGPPDPIFEFDTSDLSDLDSNYGSLLSAIKDSVGVASGPRPSRDRPPAYRRSEL
jgi:predicted kinase